MKLLIVDDSAMIRRAINQAYDGSVFTDIQTASDGLLALTIFAQQLPDVVTLDITMPHMDGLAALSKMLEIKPKTVVLVISALADHHTAIESLIRGARQFICKPFTEDDLKNALDNLLENTVRKPQHKLPVMESDQSFEKTLSHIVSTSPLFHNKTTPNQQSYPSGYVEPPKVHNTSKINKDTDAVIRQISINDIKKQIEAEKQVKP